MSAYVGHSLWRWTHTDTCVRITLFCHSVTSPDRMELTYNFVARIVEGLSAKLLQVMEIQLHM
jgi:hypothetical protein